MGRIAGFLPSGNVMIQGKEYPRERIEKLYDQLSKTAEPALYYEGSQIRGNISPGGEVSFKRLLPGIGWSYSSPQEKLEWRGNDLSADERLALQNAQANPPRKELIAMAQAFREHLDTPKGKGVYFNGPVGGLDGSRAKAYRKFGFADAIGGNQYLDNRRFLSSPAIQQIYSLMDGMAMRETEAVALAKSRALRSGVLRSAMDLTNEELVLAGVAERKRRQYLPITGLQSLNEPDDIPF